MYEVASYSSEMGSPRIEVGRQETMSKVNERGYQWKDSQPMRRNLIPSKRYGFGSSMDASRACVIECSPNLPRGHERASVLVEDASLSFGHPLRKQDCPS